MQVEASSGQLAHETNLSLYAMLPCSMLKLVLGCLWMRKLLLPDPGKLASLPLLAELD
jgi:hypothetical protein